MKDTGERTKHVYECVKINKCDLQFEITHPLPTQSFLTERVKVEKFQGFSDAYNLAEYFRLRGETSWKSGIQVSGIWKTKHKDIYYGDSREGSTKTLLIFHFEDDRARLTVYTYSVGYYPSKATIELIANAL